MIASHVICSPPNLDDKFQSRHALPKTAKIKHRKETQGTLPVQVDHKSWPFFFAAIVTLPPMAVPLSSSGPTIAAEKGPLNSTVFRRYSQARISVFRLIVFLFMHSTEARKATSTTTDNKWAQHTNQTFSSHSLSRSE